MTTNRRLFALALSAIGVLAVTASLVVAPSGSASADIATRSSLAAPAAAVVSQSVDTSQFNPGSIVSDAVFYDSSSMSESQIMTFLQQKVRTCQSGYTCLKDFRQTTTSRSADQYCPSAYQGGENETAARIIAKVAQACGINPQALLVTLQKEQGLVTHTWPSDWRYTIAMGQGCPDTADCDTRYYGFQNQVFGAARQFKIYAEGRYFTYYAPGKTWNILYNPSRSCGSSPVFIANKATSGLYYYTPYQPNAAALRAGYGTGDDCSSYGNRNFFNYFTEWFGSTQNSAGPIVQANGDPAVYLVSDGVRHHISTPSDLDAFTSQLGAITRVSASYLANLPQGPSATRYIHDMRDGTLYLLEKDGSRHRFPDADTIDAFGYRFDSYINLAGTLVDRFGRGSDVGPVIRSESSAEVYYRDGRTKRYIPSPDVLARMAGEFTGYVASMDAAPAAKLASGPTYLASWMMVQERGTPSVFVTVAGNTLLHTPSVALAEEFGSAPILLLPPGALAGWAVAPSVLSPIVTCDQAPYVASSGRLIPLSGSVSEMFPVVALTAQQCSGRPQANAATATPVFFQSPKGEVFRAGGGKMQYIVSPSELAALANGPVRVVNWTSGTIGTFEQTRPSIAAGTAVQFAGDGRVLQWDGTVLRHVTTIPALLSLYGGRMPAITTLPAVTERSFPVGAPIR
jgi:hypothetical protein